MDRSGCGLRSSCRYFGKIPEKKEKLGERNHQFLREIEIQIQIRPAGGQAQHSS